jgi:protein-tyrosine phosphatase
MWRMIWQETSDIAVVVMLTKTFELGKDKCYQYFPEDDLKPWHIRDNGEFNDGFRATIALLDKRRDTKSASTVRKLLLQVGDKKKIVWHLLFKGWPDYNVPEGDDKVALIELIKLANEKNAGRSNPLIVHCKSQLCDSVCTLRKLTPRLQVALVLADRGPSSLWTTSSGKSTEEPYPFASDKTWFLKP